MVGSGTGKLEHAATIRSGGKDLSDESATRAEATLEPRNAETREPRRARSVRWRKSLLLELEQTQWWTEQAMLSHQLGRLRRVLDHAYKCVPFYRNRLRVAGIAPTAARTLETWRTIPLLHRREIQEAGPSFYSKNATSRPDRVRSIVTSGSTGEPVAVLQSDLVRDFWRVFTLRDHLWHRRDFTQALAVIRHVRRGVAPPPDGEVRRSWGSATDGVFATGAGAMLSLDSTIEQQADWLTRQDPAYLLSYPSNLEALARHFKASGRTLSNLRQVRTIGEVVTPTMREVCREAWNVPVVDVYSAQEVGYIALQCPDGQVYHVQCENLFVEIINDDGEPCCPGEVGSVVVTTLHNFASPLIRYVLGDRAVVGEACSCGRGLPVLRRIMGRQRNMLVLPNGEQRWPALGQAGDLAELPAFHQFQVIQRSLEQVEVLLVAPQPLTAEEEGVARNYLQEMLGFPFKIAFTYVDEIPCGPSGKFEDFRSEVGLPA